MKSIGQEPLLRIVAFLLLLGPPLLLAEGTVKGSLRVDGSDTLLKHAYADDGPERHHSGDHRQALQKDQVPFGIYELAVEDKARGIAFSVSKVTKGLARGMNAIYHPSWEGQLGTIGNGALTLSKFDEGEISGTLATSEENRFDDHTYAYKVSFAVALDQGNVPEAVAVEVTGTDDLPSQAYASYYSALMAGNVEELKKYLSSTIVKRMKPAMMKQIIEVSQSTNPTQIEILGSEVSGAEALVKVKGRKGSEEGIATAQLELEDGNWKLLRDSWKF